jgi:hypothetical protein
MRTNRETGTVHQTLSIKPNQLVPTIRNIGGRVFAHIFLDCRENKFENGVNGWIKSRKFTKVDLNSG